MQYKLQKIKNDASFREFYRLYKGKKTSVIVTASKEKFKNLIAYTAVNKFLRGNAIHTPKLISKHFNEGIIEIEDFGNKTLLDNVKKSKNKLFYYKKCADVILKIQKIKPLKKIKISTNRFLKLNFYNVSNLHKESDLFFDWYLSGVVGNKKTKKYKKKIKNELNKLYKKIFFNNKFIVHRDFHVSNIMPIKNKLGIVDTQDAILGNPMYDVASLIDDVRTKVPSQIKKRTLQYYLKNCSLRNKPMHLLQNDFDILSVQRNLKILGIFYRLYKRDKKPQYLKYLPYTWKLIELRMKNKIFTNLSILLSKVVNTKLRTKKNFK